jgi:hypothetical protein
LRTQKGQKRRKGASPNILRQSATNSFSGVIHKDPQRRKQKEFFTDHIKEVEILKFAFKLN